MIRFFFLRLIVPLILFLLVRSVLRSLFAAFRSGAGPKTAGQQTPTVAAGGELKKDPVCGTYVSTAQSLTRVVDGNTLYFCSSECRDRYRAA